MFACHSKKGCTDPGSLSYDPEAKISDGNCQYNSKELESQRLVTLDAFFRENSALLYLENRLWTINDDPGENYLYSIDLITGKPREIIELEGVDNHDFESLASDGEYIYICDTGNNPGNRTDLAIYRIKIIPENQLKPRMSVPAEKISYHFADQTDFSRNTDNNLDGEGVIFYKGHLYIFTKNHGNNLCHLYKIPATPGHHAAHRIGVFNSNGLITGADIDKDGKRIILCGYDKDINRTFLWLLEDFEEDKFFAARKKICYETGPALKMGQVEGVCFFRDNRVFISNEQWRGVPPSVYQLDLKN
ncbi:MAG: hypothetical protein ACK4ND_01155 [Cytophagaceae bacterium]